MTSGSFPENLNEKNRESPQKISKILPYRMPELSIPQEPNVKVTTLTLLVSLSRNVDIRGLFLLLPVEPKLKQNGAIHSARYQGVTRGAKGRFFKNCIMLDIYLNEAVYSLKLSGNKIKVLCNNIELGKLVCKLLLEKISEIDSNIRYMSFMKEDAKEHIRNFTKVLKSNRFEEGLEKVKLPKIFLGYDEIITTVLIDLANEVTFIQEFKDFAKYLIKSGKIISYLTEETEEGVTEIHDQQVEPYIDIIAADPQMINWNYSLINDKESMIINRYKIALLFAEIPGYIVKYDNCIDHTVRIYIPHDDLNNESKKKKKKGVRTTLILQRSGNITFSGRDLKKMLEIFETVKNLAEEHWEEIIIHLLDECSR